MDQHRLRILLVPPSDWLRHPFLTRLHHIFYELAERNSVDVLWLTSETHAESGWRGGVRLWPVKTRTSRSAAVNNVLASFPVAWRVAKILRKGDYDVVVVSNIVPALVLSLFSRLRGIPCVFDYSDHLPDSASLYSKSRVVKLLVRAVVYLVVLASMELCTSAVCSSDSLSSVVKREYHMRRRVSIIPNGYDASFLKSNSNREGLLGELGLGLLSGHFIVVFVGSLEDRYDFDTVLRAMDSLYQRGRRVSLVIVGKAISTDFESNLRIRCSRFPFVSFVGYVKNYSSVSDYLNIADACIAPYKLVKTNYGITIKVMEYLASGKPILVTPIPDVVNQLGKCVVVYDSQRELEAGLERLMDNRGLGQELVRCGREYVQRLSWKELAMRYEEELTLIASGTSRRVGLKSKSQLAPGNG